MDYIKFINANNVRSVRLTINNGDIAHRAHTDDLIGLDKDTATVEYFLDADKYKLYKKYEEKIDALLITYGLNRESQVRLIKSSLLFYTIEFDRRLEELKRDKARYARLDNMVQFLKIARSLSPEQIQKVEVSLLIKNQPFNLDDQPFLSEAVMHKLSGMITETIRHGYPELWDIYFKAQKPLIKERATAESVLRNAAVVETTKRIIAYLNQNSVGLGNKKVKVGEISMTSKQGYFIYDLLTALKIYKPRDVAKNDTGGKEANYHGLRKLLKRYQSPTQ